MSKLLFSYSDLRSRLSLMVALAMAPILAFTSFVRDRFILGKIRRLLVAMEHLTAGDLTARTGMAYDSGELGQVAYSFDKMAAMLEQRHLRLQALFDHVQDTILLIDDEGQIVEANPAGCALFGYSREQLLQMRLWEVLPLLTNTPLDRTIWAKLIHQGKQSDQFSLNRTNETRLDLHFQLIPQIGSNLHLLILQDISEHKRAEAEILRRNQELMLLNRVIATSAASLDTEVILDQVCRDLAQAFNVSQTGVVLLNKKKTEGTVVAEYQVEERFSVLNRLVPTANNRFYQYLLKNKAPLVVRDARVEPNLPPLHAEMCQHGMVSLFLIPLLVEGQVIGNLGMNTCEERTFSAEEISLAWSVADQVAGALARARLAEERRQLQEQYHQSQKMETVGQLAAGIAHDFNNLLTAINGFSALLQDELLADDPRRELASKILHSGQRAADLVRQLLTFSRKQIIRPQRLDLNTHVLATKKILERTISEHISLETRLRPELWAVEVDPSQIEQVIVNLVVNARDAMPYGGRLTIETDHMVFDKETAHLLEIEPGDYVMLVVSDTGVGMNEAVRAHIFEPFFTTKEVGKGTGLGLATVFGIVKQNKGHIEVYSEEGEGATFKIYLPCAAEGVRAPVEVRSEEKVPLGSETILLVEDDAGVRKLAERVLQRQGYGLLVAENGQEALELAAQHDASIHLLLTDVVMPGISGHSLAEQLRQKWPDLKILFISGYADQALGIQGIWAPAAFLQKPFSPPVLARKVRTVLDS